MGTIRKVVVGALAGGALGLAFPIGLALLYLAFGGDSQGAGAFSFFPIVLIPAGLVLGGFVGSVWSRERSVLRNVAAGLWRMVRPNWM